MVADSGKQAQKRKKEQYESYRSQETHLRIPRHMVSATFPFIEFAADTAIRYIRNATARSRTLAPRKPQCRRCGGS